MSPGSSPNWSTTSHVNANYEESKFWWTLGAKQVLHTSVGMGRRKNIIFYEIKIMCDSSHHLPSSGTYLKVQDIFFLEFLRKLKIWKKKDVSHARRSIASLCDLESLSLYQMLLD